MSGGRRSKLSPSLFPFLAVLVCTLGTLILLLALVAEKATNAAAVAKVEAEPETSDSPHPGLTATAASSMIEEEEFLVTQLVSVRQAQTADIEQRRDKLAHVEEHTRRLKDELKRLSDEVDRASQIAGSDDDVTDQQLAILKRQIEIEEHEIEKQIAESGSRKPRVIIVPHKGPNGTDRRPVYLECTGNELVIWPEQIRVSIDQLKQSETGANPVESALRVIRNHAMTQYGDSVPPYPLLVVRPDGILTYAAARGAMQDYDDQFGYELVPTDIELAISKPDANLKQKINRAITEAIANQTRRERIAMQNNHGDGIGSGRRLPVLSAAALDRNGRSNGYRTLGRDEQNLYTQQAGDARSIARSYADDRASSRSSGSPSVSYGKSDSAGKQSVEFTANAGNDGIDPAMEQKWSDDMRQAADELRGGSFDGSGAFDENGNPKSLLDSYFEGANDGNTNQVAQPNGLDGQSGETGEGKMPTQNPNAASGGSAGAGQPQNGSSQPGPSQQQNSQDQPTNSSDGQTPPPENQYSQTPTKDLAQPGSPGWALPRDVARSHGNEIMRTIRAESRIDRFVLLPSDRRLSPEMFGVFDRDARRASLELATAVRDRVEQWGAALPGGRWQPVLEVDVKPGGEVRFQQLQSIMQESGVQIVPKN